MNKAIFLDRDGTIIKENGYICSWEESEVFSFAYQAVRMMNENSYKVIGITNQSSIARGICTVQQVENLHFQILEKFLQQQAVIEKFYYCPYHKEGIIEPFNTDHHWRKPSPGMILQAARDFNIDVRQSYMVGDQMTDIQAGIQAGCKTILVLTGKGIETQKQLEKKNIQPHRISENILTAINEIINI